MTSTRWSDDLLDRMRLVGDEPADRAVAALFEAQGTPEWMAIHRQLDSLVDDNSVLPAGLPAELTDYLASTTSISPSLRADAAAGEAFFAQYGPEVLMLLGCYSLPAAYAAAKGAQVLCRTEFLEKAARLRLFQTAQMIVDVMSPGGLGRGGKGIRAVQKVRLLHASIRHLILKGSPPWDTTVLGVPINQEDLAGTMLTFSTVILDGLGKFDIAVPPEQAAAYLDAWCVVGRMMGIREELIPADLASARVLTDTIQRRQIAASPEGRRLTAALLAAMGEGLSASTSAATHGMSLLGQLRDDLDAVIATMEASVGAPLLRATANVLMRHCLQDETDAHGTSVAEILALPPAESWASHLADVVAEIGGHIVGTLTDTTHQRRMLRWINMRLIESMVAKELGPGRSLFSVPDSLHAQWKRGPTS
jgi:mpaB/rubber oxygenase-like protein